MKNREAMNYKMDDDYLLEKVAPVFDKTGREYYLEIHYFYNSEGKIVFKLIRKGRNCQVGKASCLFKKTEEIFLADIFLENNLAFESIDDKIFKILHWGEPKNYRGKGLGSYLLRKMIEVARNQGIKKIYGDIEAEDLKATPYLIDWYKSFGFKKERG
ncbi:MAG: GNAT family N-acetyltransferase, partial [Okeania sp. SIO2H7]|nr:GNAT family N-acetyltransferase [Okeania sp. SIO2H7]